MSKPLDLSDTYDSSDPYSGDEEITIKMVRPTFAEERTYPNVGLLIILCFTLSFWGGLAYFIFR